MASRREKLFDAICNNPRGVRFVDACKAAELLGFNAKAQAGSSHHCFAKAGEMGQLNFQKQNGGVIKPYQAKQLVQMIEKYWDPEKDELR